MIVLGCNQWAYIDRKSRHQGITTYWLGCDFVVFFITKHWAIMMRMGADTDLDSFQKIINKINEINGGTLQDVRVIAIGGSPSFSRLTGTKITKILFGNIPISFFSGLPGQDHFCFRTVSILRKDLRPKHGRQVLICNREEFIDALTKRGNPLTEVRE